MTIESLDLKAPDLVDPDAPDFDGLRWRPGGAATDRRGGGAGIGRGSQRA